VKEDDRWWQRSDCEPHEVVYEIARRLEDTDTRRADNRRLRDLYADEAEGGFAKQTSCRRDNVVANAIDAVHSRLSKNRPRPWVVTIGGDFDLTERAKLLTSWLDGEFERLNVYQHGEQALLEAEITGTGCLHVYERENRPRVELCYAEDIHVDTREEEHDCVRTMYRLRAIDRQVLTELYPEKDQWIADAKGWDPEDDDQRITSDSDDTADLVLVIEAWRLASGKDSPGRHVIVVDNATLLDEDYDREDFPFVFMHWAKRPRRFWGIGLARRMAGIQQEIDGMAAHIAESFHLSTASVWVQNQAKIGVERIDNKPWRVYRYSGTVPPIFNTPSPIHPQFTDREEVLIRRGYEMQGISQLGAQSQKPAGIDSGRGLRTLHDIETERFLTQGRSYERLYIDLSTKLVRCAETIIEREPKADLEVLGGGRVLEAIDFGDAMFGDSPHHIRTFPVSSLSQSPQGRLKDIEDLVNLQVITDPDDVRELLDWPDLDRFNTIKSAKRDLARKIVDHAAKGKDTAGLVCPYVDLPYLVEYGTLIHNLAELEGASLDDLDNLRKALGMAESLMRKQAEQAAAAAPMPPAGMPPMNAPAGAPPGLAAVPPM
jgi:hypothetical protein